MTITKWYTIYLALCSCLAFVLYGVDKRKAKRAQWRISEKCLLCLSLLGGGIGGYAAMHVFHHKTKHWYFHVLHCIGIVGQIAMWIVLWRRFGF